MKVLAALVLLSATCAFGTPVEDEGIAPMFDAERDVRFLLVTRQNRESHQIVLRDLATVPSFFDRNRPTRFLIHGWFGDDETDLNINVANELLDYNDFNIIIIDWSEGAQTINYIGAVNRVPSVGVAGAAFVDWFQANGLLQLPQLTVIGFSLGAHVAGHMGKNVRSGRINTIIGLDPAGPLFSVGNPGGRLDAADADYVECVHTNGPTLLIAGAGIGEPIGDADFFPNGGRSQPGCILNSCSHSRAVELYVDSIQNNALHALGCPDRNDINEGRCNQGPGAWLGGDGRNYNKNYRGSFFLTTNSNAPFGRGPARP